MNTSTGPPAVGTLPWARETLGALTRRDRIHLLTQAVALQGTLIASLLFKRARIAGDIAEMKPPDSDIAVRAATLCAEVSSAKLFNHCCRSYLWGRLIAQAEGIRFDDELLYVACMLHDLGLTSAYNDCARHGACFTLDSVEGASPVLKGANWDTARQDAVAEAILLHMNATVAVEQGAEAHLLHEAASLDCLGLRAWEITRATRNAVVQRHPRDQFKPFLIETFSAEAKRRPNSRTAFHIRYLFFRPFIRFAPFDE